MQVNVTFRHLEPSDSLKAFAREKVEKVQKFLDQAAEANIVLSIEKHLHHVEVLVHSGPYFLRSKEKSDDMYASIGTAVDKIERQIKKYKSRMRTFKPARHHDAGALRVRQEILEVDPRGVDDDALEVESTEPPPSARVVKANELVARRMSVDEAVVQLDVLETDFLVFTNEATDHVAVLYRRKEDGTYGLIDARPAT